MEFELFVTLSRGLFTMVELESTIQKLTLGFCKSFSSHVELWQNLLQECNKPVETLCTYEEQLKHIKRANVSYLEESEQLIDEIVSKINEGVEEEVLKLKQLIHQLNQSCNSLKNELKHLENMTLDLNWESNTPLIKGTAFQPPLQTILMEGYDIVMFFRKTFQNINEQLKILNLNDEKSMDMLKHSFRVHVDRSDVRNLMALIQYVC